MTYHLFTYEVVSWYNIHMLNNEEYLKLIEKYTKLYRGKYLNDGGKWIQLTEVKVAFDGGQSSRHADAMLDFNGNLWWILDELEPAMAAGKVKPLKELSTSYNVIGYC